MRVLELQADLKELSKKLDAQEHNVRQAEREKTALLDELTQQNQRLTVQLQEANQLELQLNVQLQEVRDQYSQRNTSLQVSRTGLNYSAGGLDRLLWGNSYASWWLEILRLAINPPRSGTPQSICVLLITRIEGLYGRRHGAGCE